MDNRFTPLICSLALTGGTCAFWYYALNSMTGLPAWAAAFPGSIVTALALLGVFFASGIRTLRITPYVYMLGLFTTAAGFWSFYVFIDPTTINLFGFVAIVVGLLVSDVAGLVIALRAKPRK